MTTNILLVIGVIWFLSIATVAEVVVTAKVIGYILKHVKDDGLSCLAAMAAALTTLAMLAILWISAMPFVSERFPEENAPAKATASSEYAAAEDAESANTESALMSGIMIALEM